MYTVSHAFEVCFAEYVGHGRGQLNSGFRLKEGMIAFLITAAVVGVMLIIVMKECGLAASGAGRIFARTKLFNVVRRELMFANTALIFLITEFILAIFI